MFRAPLIALSILCCFAITASADPQTKVTPAPFSEDWYRNRISEVSQAETELASVMDGCKHYKNAKAYSDCVEEKAFAIAEMLGDTPKDLNMEPWTQTLEILLCLEEVDSPLDLACVRKKVKTATATFSALKRQCLDRLKRLELKNSITSVDQGNAVNRPSAPQIVERKAFNAKSKKLEDATTAAPAATSDEGATKPTAHAKTSGAK